MFFDIMGTRMTRIGLIFADFFYKIKMIICENQLNPRHPRSNYFLKTIKH